MKPGKPTCAGIVLIAALFLLGMVLPSGMADAPRESGRAAQVKDMFFWLHWDPTSPTVNGKATQLTFNTTQYWTKSNYTIDGDKNLAMDFYMVPVLASGLSVNGTVTLGFWGNYSGSNNNFQVQTVIYERNATGNENWTSSTYTSNYNPASAPQYYSFQFANFQHVFAAGSTIRINLQVTGGNGIYKAVYIDTGTNNSRIVLPCEDYLDVPSVNTFDHQGNPQGGFQASAVNTTVLMRATVTDPLGGYDIRWANLTLVGPAGNTILDNVSMAKTGGTPVSFSNTYESAWNYTGAAPGRYNITVWAVDNSGYYYYFYFMNFNFGYYSMTNTTFFFIGTPRYVNVKALDSMGIPLSGAEVHATILGNITDRNLTNLNGLTNLSMQPGPYRFRVHWKGVMVSDEQIDVTENFTESNPLVIYCWVYYPEFLAVDSHALPLVDAAVYVRFPNGTATILPFHTDSGGKFNFTQAPLGPYELSVVWGGLEVNRSLVLVRGNETYTVVCDVFYLTVKVTDPHGSPVPSAQIVITDNTTRIVADSRLTDSGGAVTFRLPRHLYDLTVYWNEAVVYEGWGEPLLADREMGIVCGIYYLTVQAVDSWALPIENALTVVSISSNSKVMDSRLSGADGQVTIRVPGGLYNVTVYWQDLLVFRGADIQVAGDSTFIANCSVHYLTVVAVDAKGVALENAQVQVYSVATGKLLDARTSDSVGNLTSRLPATELSFIARWQDVVVNTTHSYTLTGDDTLVLHCSVYYLTVQALDSKGVPVQAAQVKISFANGGKLLDVQSADYEGRTVSRLPASELSLRAFWQDVLVNQTDSYLLTGDGNGEAFLTLDCWVYYLEVMALDSRGIALEDSFITVSLVTGRQVETRLSNESGAVVVRVPIGLANLTVTWSDVVVGVVIEHMVNSNHLLTIQCSVFYLRVTITDSQEKEVPNAQVAFRRVSSGKTMSTLTTGPHGNTTFRLPAETYSVSVIWQDQLVSPETQFQLAQDGELIVKCRIYYLTVKPVDSRGFPIENATVVFLQELTGNILDTKVTGADGSVTARLPLGLHILYITWKDVVVNVTPNYDLVADATLTIGCRVYYLTVNPLDASGISISESEVIIYPEGRPDLPSSLTADATGKVTFRLPAQDYDLRVSWRGVEVCSRSGYSLTGDAILPLQCKVFYLTVRITDKDGKSLEGVQLTVYTLRQGLAVEVAGSATTNSSSRWIFRLPVGEYNVVARYTTTYMLTPVDISTSRTVALNESLTVTIALDSFPIPFYTTNAFYVAILVILLVVLAAATVYYVYRKFGRKPPARAAGMAEEKEWAEGEGEPGEGGLPAALIDRKEKPGEGEEKAEEEEQAGKGPEEEGEEEEAEEGAGDEEEHLKEGAKELKAGPKPEAPAGKEMAPPAPAAPAAQPKPAESPKDEKVENTIDDILKDLDKEI